MADTKITALTALTAADPANDVIPIVDVSDTSMAASGTTKKISVNNILGASGTATLASATITGALTVDTTTLVVNPSGYADRVGIRTATPAEPLTIDNTSGVTTGALRVFATDQSQSRISIQNTNGQAYHLVAGNPGASNAGFALYDNTAAATRLYVDNTGIQTWQNVGGGSGTAMTLNATGLGVGMSPSATLSALKSSATQATGLILRNANGTDGSSISLDFETSAGTSGVEGSLAGRISGRRAGGGTTGALDFFVNNAGTLGSAKMTLDASGNLLVGRTSGSARLDVGSARAASVVGGIIGTTGTGVVADECQFLIKNVNTASGQNNGAGIGGLLEASASNKSSLLFYVDNGTAVTNVGRFDSNGNLILQSSATPSTLTTNGQLTVNATSNTNLRFSYRGSDGTTRVANITLA